MKKIVTFLLLAFIGVSVAALVYQNFNETETNTELAENADAVIDKPENRLAIYYLHGDVRCQTCEKLEKFSTKAVMDNYSEQIENGTVEFLVMNYDKPENQHFLTDFEISFQSLIVIDIKDNKQIGYENLEKIWDMTHDEQAYLDYVKERVDEHVMSL